MKFISNHPLCFVAAVALLPALATMCQGQQGSGSQGISRMEREAREAREREMNERNLELQLRMLSETRRPVERREPRPTFALIRDDYVRLQVVNNDLARVVAMSGALDLKFVSTAAAEIKKRASRLKINIALPEPEQSAKRSKTVTGTEAEQLKSSLASLDKLILGFVRNSIFTKPTVVDIRQSAAARRDLDEIIELSGQIKKSSEQLDQAARKSH